MTDEEYRDCLARLDKAKDNVTTSVWFKHIMGTPYPDIMPCKNCGRCVYVGRCCDKPDCEVVYRD